MKPIFPRAKERLTALLLALGVTFACAEGELPKKSARVAPTWLRQGVVYELFPRTFSATGDFNGITARLDELKDLGVNVLWLMPIHPLGEKLKKGSIGSPYAVKDYYAINPDYGTAKDLKRLVAAAHQRGLKVIIDIVANHTAWDSVMMKHPEYYKRDAAGKIIPPVPDWSDVAGLDYTNAQLRAYMTDMLKFWLKTYDLDGFRCDVAFMVPTDFWDQARLELENVKPDIMLLAEASKPELLLQAFDIDYAWPLHSALNQVLLEGAPASELRKSWEETRKQFPQGSLHLRFADNHDEARAVARFGIRGALAAEVLMFALDGVPLLYNGMEVGDATESGAPALFEKMPVYWQPKDRPPLRDIYRSLIKLRRESAAFQNNQVVWLGNSEEASVVSLQRQDDRDEFVVLVNFSNRAVTARVEVKDAAEFAPVKITGAPDIAVGDFPTCHLKGFEWRIYHRTMKR